jgi:hypothetical protein
MKSRIKLLWPILILMLGVGYLTFFHSSASAQRVSKRNQNSTMLDDLGRVKGKKRLVRADKPVAMPQELPPFVNPDDKYPIGMLEDREPAAKLHVRGIDKAKPTYLPVEPKP